jgi:hypothetical protein
VKFDRFIGIDYSGAGAASSRQPGLQVYQAGFDGHCDKLPSPTKSNNGGPVNWTRKEIAHRLLQELQSGGCFLAGIDHCFSLPLPYFTRNHLGSWPDFLEDFAEHWPTTGDNVYVDFVRDGNFHRTHGGPAPGQRGGEVSEFRLCERWTSSAKSVFQFDVQGSVAKSTHAGIPWLRWLRKEAGDRLHIWPFDGWEPQKTKSVIVEVYPSIFKKRYDRETRTADEQDAYATARWMFDMAQRGALADYFAPPLSDSERLVANREGWIFGVR